MQPWKERCELQPRRLQYILHWWALCSCIRMLKCSQPCQHGPYVPGCMLHRTEHGCTLFLHSLTLILKIRNCDSKGRLG